MGFETIKELKVTKPVRGQFKRSGAGPFRYVREFRYKDGEWKVGQQLTVELFEEYELVDVTGISIGKGFQGGGKRYHWSGGPKSHGSMSHRAPGSIGAGTSPGRVLKGHHLPGHMGADRVTVQNLRVVRCDLEHHLLIVEGAIPGVEQELVMIRKSAKRPGVIKKPHVLLADTVVEEAGKRVQGFLTDPAIQKTFREWIRSELKKELASVLPEQSSPRATPTQANKAKTASG